MCVARGCATDGIEALKLAFHDADTDTDIVARILADTSDARFPENFPVASSTTRRHSRDYPREDVGKELRVGVGVHVRVGAVECQLKPSRVCQTRRGLRGGQACLLIPIRDARKLRKLLRALVAIR